MKKVQMNDLKKLSDGGNIKYYNDEKEAAKILQDCLKNKSKGNKTINGSDMTNENIDKILSKDGISVEINKNIDRLGTVDNITVKIIWDNTEIVDEREVNINAVFYSKQIIVDVLINMGYKFDEVDKTANLIMELIKQKNSNGEYKITYDKVGWIDYKKQKVFKLFNLISKNEYIDSKYNGDLAIERKGDLKGYIDGLTRLVVGKPRLELAFIVGVYGVILQALNISDCNLIINFYGKNNTNRRQDGSGIGKTTASKLPLMMWGNANELIERFNNTENKMEKLYGEYEVIPFVIDDLLVKIADKSKRKAKEIITKLVFTLSDGRVKGRLTDKTKNNKIYAPVIITAEGSLVEHMVGQELNGQFARIIEIFCQNGDLTSSKEHSDQINEFISKYAGIGAEEFVKYLINEDLIENNLRDKYNQWLDKLYSSDIADTNLGGRVSKKIAIIMLSAELLNNCFNLDMNLDNIQSLLVNSVMKVIEKKQDHDIFYYKLCDFVKNNRERFVDNRANFIKEDENGEYTEKDHLGHYKYEKGEWKLYIEGNALNVIFRSYKELKDIPLIEQIARDWRVKGILLSGYEKDSRLTEKLTLWRKGKQKNVYIIKMIDFNK